MKDDKQQAAQDRNVADIGRLQRDDREISPTGGVRGKPAAEYGAYGMIKKGSDEAKGASEEEIRGIKPLP